METITINSKSTSLPYTHLMEIIKNTPFILDYSVKPDKIEISFDNIIEASFFSFLLKELNMQYLQRLEHKKLCENLIKQSASPNFKSISVYNIKYSAEAPIILN